MHFRSLTATLLAASLALPAFAQDKITLTFAGVDPPDVPRSVALVDIFAEEIGDEFSFEPFFSGTLLNQGAELVAIQRGNIDMAGLPPSDLAQQVPEFDILGAAYVVRDQPHLKAIFGSEVGDQLRQIARDKLGVVILGTFYYGMRHVNLRGDATIDTPADLAGVTLRMPGGEGWQFLGSSIGANPVPIAYAELYVALQTGVVDGQDNPLSNNRVMNFHEVTNQIVLTGHNVGIGILLISAEVFDGLTPEQQQKIQAAADKATAWSDEQYLQQESELVAFFEGEGLKVYTPDVAAFQEHAQKMYLESPLSAAWPEGMLEAINGL